MLEAQLLVGCVRVASGPLQGSAAKAIICADRVRRFSGHCCNEGVARRLKALWLWLWLRCEKKCEVTHMSERGSRPCRYENLDGAVRASVVHEGSRAATGPL